MSHNQASTVTDGQHSEIENSGMAAVILRFISPLILIFGTYLMLNGHISAGGGFQGGLAIAAFFICRYMIHDIYDMPIKKVLFMEKIIFISILILSAIAVVLGAAQHLPADYIPVFQIGYLITMNVFIGLKVACVFFTLFYRYIAIESSDESENDMGNSSGSNAVERVQEKGGSAQ
jgi:multicomponent Na+:H+ antiporter subunit B